MRAGGALPPPCGEAWAGVSLDLARSAFHPRPTPGRRPPRKGEVKGALSHRTFERDRDQLLGLDREFHRQLLQHVLDEAVDDQGRGLLVRQAALLAVEQLVLR